MILEEFFIMHSQLKSKTIKILILGLLTKKKKDIIKKKVSCIQKIAHITIEND
jgi:hypothetical protein